MSGSGNFLYWGSGSPPCWRLMIVLEEKNVQYEQKLLSFGKQEHKSDEILKLNPRGQLPTFKFGDLYINESSAACAFVEEQCRDQGNSLMPAEPKKKALVMQRKDEFLANVNKISADIYFLMRGNAPSQEEQDKKLAAAKAELKTWDGYVKDGFVAGDSFSLADAIFFPNIALMVRYGLDLSANYPNLDAYYKKVVGRKSVQASWPPHWKEGPGNALLKDKL